MKQPPTKTEATKLAYLARARNLIAKYERMEGRKINTNDAGFIPFLINETTQKSVANWRQLKASCVHYFKQTDQNYLAEEIAKLTNGHTNKKSPLSLTSAKKKKSVSSKELKKINAHLMASANSDKPSAYDRITVSMFNAILAVGLRPCEWEKAKVITERIEGIPLSPPILKVKNAKATNGRSFAEFRYIGMSDLDEISVKFIEFTIYNCQSPKDSCGKSISFEHYYKHIRNRMRQTVKKIFPRSQSNITMYSARHQLIANLKHAGLSRPEIACIVGHGNDITATEHYGKKRSGFSETALPLHNKADISKIRMRFREHELNQVKEQDRTN